MNEVTTEARLARLVQLADDGRYQDVLDGLPELAHTEDEEWVEGCARGLELVCLKRLQHADRFAERYEALLKESEDKGNILLGAGILCSDMGIHELAETVLEVLCERHPESHIPTFNLGLVLSRSERHTDALRYYDQAIQREYRHAPSYRHKALSLRRLRRLDEAAIALSQLLKLEPEDGEAWTMLGAVEGDRGKFEEAFAAFDKARDLTPESLTLYYYQAVSAAKANDGERLNFCASSLESIDPDAWSTALVRSFVAERQGNIDDAWSEALTAMERATQTDETDTVSHVAQSVIELAERHDLEDRCRAFVDEFLARDVAVPPILELVRRDKHRHSETARCYSVIVDATITDDRLLRTITKRGGDKTPPYNYLRSYQVWADSPEEAGELALDFEAEHGRGTETRVDSVEPVSEPQPAHVGVSARHTMMVYPREQGE
jgi:tetratricopeptide (TPR) repeat protein